MTLNHKKIFGFVITLLILISVNEASAKKMGGGASIGRQSSTITRNQNALPPKPVAPPVNAAPKPAQNPASAPQAPAPQPSRFGGFGGILGGIAAGIGLSYLFSHFGMGAEMGAMFSNILLLVAVAFIGLWLFRKFVKPQVAPSMSSGFSNMDIPQAPQFSEKAWNEQNTNSAIQVQTIPNSNQLPLIGEASTFTGVAGSLTPNSFADKEHFLENAKSLFLQLQEASDKQNIEVLKEFTSPELFAILRKDMLARSTAISYTQVLTLAADLLAVEEENQEYLASVRFSGSMREELNGPIEEFAEVWNWYKPIDSSTGWILCGIQQIN